jgi:uncharacterized protein YerC
MSTEGATYSDVHGATGAAHMTTYRIVKRLKPYTDAGNPEHSLLGKKGPHNKTLKHVDRIRQMVAEGATYKSIRSATGLCLNTICKVANARPPFSESDADREQFATKGRAQDVGSSASYDILLAAYLCSFPKAGRGARLFLDRLLYAGMPDVVVVTEFTK